MSTSTPKPLLPVTPGIETILRASGLRRTFRMGESDVQVLKGLELSVRRGEFIAIEGRSGSGKSTLLHILAGLDAADGGSIELDGEDIGELAMAVNRHRKIGLLLAALGFSDRRLARIRDEQFGFVFQFYHLLPELNVLENTLLTPSVHYSWFAYSARKKELEDRAIKLLESLGMGHRLKHKPSQLSGGERQRVAIARALMNNPRIIFADEPTGNLDSETGQQIMGVLEKLHKEKGQTIVMVTHDRAIAHRADRILVLKDGRLERPADKETP
jgi:lipoprotein-releasing system ATP-binding protein